MNKREKQKALLEGKYMHVRCTTHICILIVENELKKLHMAVLTIRNVMKYVRFSLQRLDNFKTRV